MRYLIGIDDTDNLETRGTGHRVRQLTEWLSVNDVAAPQGITRHQLLVDARIPYTSHNSSACLSLETQNVDVLWEAARQFLLVESAPGADVGLCLAKWDSIDEGVTTFGRRAKSELVTMAEAEQTASGSGLRAAALTGTGGGIIGALAAIGLHRSGNDGRFLWLPGLRELHGRHPVSRLHSDAHIGRVCTLDGTELAPQMFVNIGEWVRPVLQHGQATLLVEQRHDEWHILSKEQIKAVSN